MTAPLGGMDNRLRQEARLRKARLYQDRAVRVRSLASQEKDKALREAMLKLAVEYDELYERYVDPPRTLNLS